MKKTLPLIINDTKQAIVDAINNAQLPMCVLEPIIKDIMVEVSQGKVAEYQAALKQYNAGVEAEKNKVNTEKVKTTEAKDILSGNVE